MGEAVVLPGSRPIRAVHDQAGSSGLIVACPPDPRAGGSRSDARLRAVSEALTNRGIDCLRIAYGDQTTALRDAERALEWGQDRYKQIGLFGYSFGGSVAITIASAPPVPIACVSVAAPAVDEVGSRTIAGPLQVITGDQDRTVESVPDWLAATATSQEALPTGHGFSGVRDALGAAVGQFVAQVFDAPKSF